MIGDATVPNPNLLSNVNLRAADYAPSDPWSFTILL